MSEQHSPPGSPPPSDDGARKRPETARREESDRKGRGDGKNGRPDGVRPDARGGARGARPGGKPSSRQDDRRGGRDSREGGKPGGRASGLASAIIDLDAELMKLLARRSKLVARLFGGRDHAATPAAIQGEKAVRLAWEAKAPAFSKDPRFARQFFALLQDMRIMTREEARDASAFTLSPPKQPLSGSIAGPASTQEAQMRVALCACLGLPLTLERAMFAPALLDTVKACAQAGANTAREATGAGLGLISLRAGEPLRFAGKSIYAGEDLFTLYLLAFLAAGRPGSCRFTGGPTLKNANLAPLRNALPLFGARLAHVVPRSQGLPANLECSGEIPPLVVAPPDLPFEGLCALLLAPLAWGTPLALNLAALPAATATAALAEVRPLHREAGAEVETHGTHIAFTPGPIAPPEKPVLSLDPALSAYLLALPAFAGGSLRLAGRWTPQRPEAVAAVQLLAWAGLELVIDSDGVGAEIKNDPFRLPLQCADLSPALGPLYLALLLLRRTLAGKQASLPAPAPFPQEETDGELASEFFARFGLALSEGSLEDGGDGGREDEAPGTGSPEWTSPGPYWSMAYALGAFIRPGLRLANPGSASEGMPFFWSVYNSLPKPLDPALPKEKPEEVRDDHPARRRIIADS